MSFCTLSDMEQWNRRGPDIFDPLRKVNQMSSGKQPFSEEGYALMGAAFEVHNEIGGGLAEEIYLQSLEIELELRGIPFRVRQELKVFTRIASCRSDTSRIWSATKKSSWNSSRCPLFFLNTKDN